MIKGKITDKRPVICFYVFIMLGTDMLLSGVYSKKHAFFCCRVFLCTTCTSVLKFYSITVSQLAGILSPINHKWLHQGEKQCSVCLLFTLHASYQNTHYLKMTKSVRTQIYRKHTNIKVQTQNFQRISPFGIDPVKKST